MKRLKQNIKEFLNNINKKRFKLSVFASSLLLLWIIIAFSVPTTVSKFYSETNSNAETAVAFYLVKASYQNATVLLDEITPRNEPYIYNFSISNNDNSARTETNLQYNLSIRTTTNLPLTYNLYLNSTYTDQNAQSIITNQELIQDSNGTYFNKFSTATEYFSHSYNETNNYQLVVYFPSNYVDEMYQDIIESIEITVDSKQIIDD